MKLPAALVLSTLIACGAFFGPDALDQFRARSIEERRQTQAEQKFDIIIEFPTREIAPHPRGLRQSEHQHQAEASL